MPDSRDFHQPKRTRECSRTSVARRRGQTDAEDLSGECFGALGAFFLDDFDRDVARFIHEVVIAKDVAEAEARDAGLSRAEKFAGAAELEVALGDFEAVARFREDGEAILLIVRDEDAVGRARAAADAAAQLVKLRESETMRVHD